MIGFQFFTLIVLCMFFIGFLSILRRKKGILNRTAAVVVLSVITMIVTIFVDPNISQRIAEWAGIGRGADMMIYLAIFFLLFSIFAIYLRIKHLELMMTEIARQISLMQAKVPSQKER